MRDTLFVIRAPFEDEGAMWFCRDCALLEGALLANPHWANRIDVRRLPYPRPRREIISLLGEDKQDMPVLVLGESSVIPEEVQRYDRRSYLTDPKAIARYLAAAYGGAGPHP